MTSLQTIVSQEQMKVSGIVVSTKNKPVNDVSVSVEGSDATPVLTNENGEFTVSVKSGNDRLFIRPIGNFKSKTVYVNNRSQLVISLSEKDMQSAYDEIQLMNRKEVRRDIVTSHSDIDLRNVQNKNIVSIEQAFQGKVPGMLTTNHSGMPGFGAVNYIRGINSIHSSNTPLIVVDGVPLEYPGTFGSFIKGNSYNPLTTIDPSDISSVTILRDATATSNYGLKGANGVVLIETLKPEATETSIKVSLQTGLNLANNKYIPQLNSRQYKTLANEILVTSPTSVENFDEEYPGLYYEKSDKEYLKYMHNTNWQEKIFTNSQTREAYLSVKGGSNIATYGLSVGYNDQGGIYKNTNYNRFNVLFVSDLNMASWFRMKVNANLSNVNMDMKESGLSPQTSPLTTSLFKPPIMGSYQQVYVEEEGRQVIRQLSSVDEVDELGTSNPTAVVKNYHGENKNYRFLSSIKGEARLSNSLKLNTLIGLNVNSLKESVFKPNKGMAEYFNQEAHNVSQKMSNYLFSLYSDNYLDFKNTFNSIHELNGSLGVRINTNNLEVDYGETKNSPENDEFKELQSGQGNLRRLGGNNKRWNWLSVYNYLNYKLKDKYLLNAALAIDYSTVIGNEAQTPIRLFDKNFGLFYSIGAGWRLSQENIFKQIEGLDNLLLRASYGISGNDDLGNYNALKYYTVTKYRETSGLAPGSISNESLKYEKTSQLNLGFDLSLWGDRTRFTTNFFYFNTEDMLIFIPQPSYLGFSYKPFNGGAVQNSGFEFFLYQRIIDNQNFKWNLTASLTYLKNEVSEIKGGQSVTDFEGGAFVTKEGSPVNSFYGYQYDGVFVNQQEADSAGIFNKRQVPFRAGDAKFRDISGPENEPDNLINNYDRIVLGSPMPDYHGSFSSSFSYKRWTLSTMLQFVYGNEIFNYVRYINERMVDLSNQSQYVLNRWQREGDVTDVPRASWDDPVGNSDFSSRWIEDGSYLRLKNIMLEYSIPSDFLVFKNASFYITASNVLTFHKYLGFDPEFSNSHDPLQQGIDYGLMPQHRQFLIGVNIGL